MMRTFAQSLSFSRFTPPKLFVLSFLFLIVIGASGFLLVPAFYVDERLGFVQAIFTATSAVCVTGLIVVDTATFFTPLGQAWILLLIQLGGLGMLTFTSLIILSFGGRLSLRHEAVARSSAEIVPQIDYKRLLPHIVGFTLIAEAIGFLWLYASWIGDFGWTGALWPALFHAVSAFCNAGFSTFSDSLTQYHASPITLVPIMVLVVAGGLGFLTIEELRLWWSGRRSGRSFRLSIHSTLVLITTAVLLVLGWALYLLFEFAVTLEPLSWSNRALNSLFMSVTARTAGFNTVDYAEASDAANFLTVILMFIGGSPGSTAGGMKTTTLALIFLLAYNRLRGSTRLHIAGRTIPGETSQRAVGLLGLAMVIMTIAVFIFTATELFGMGGQGLFLHFLFEVVSAFNTVGLSMGVTGDLTILGKWTTIILMFVGRVGPLTVAAALAVRASRGPRQFRYAYEDVVVG